MENKDFDSLVAAQASNWNETERQILSYLLANQRTVSTMSVQAVAAATYTSPSSVMRVSKKLGFSGFAELKYYLRSQIAGQQVAVPRSRLELQAQDIQSTIAHLRQQDFDPLAQHILDAGTVYCIGTGMAQRNALREFAKSLLNNGIRAVQISDLTEFLLVVPLMQPDDVVVLASLSGETKEYVDIPERLKLRNIPLLAVTRTGPNRMAQAARWNVQYSATAIQAEWHPGKYYSFVGLSIVLDYLVRYIMDCR
ncbi:MAG: MurR/RpiR family transcriptional regulator [Corynebacterium sp.]|nr:MurR/RpiR family transcriptional regulator [Corynebacterium sp.]